MKIPKGLKDAYRPGATVRVMDSTPSGPPLQGLHLLQDAFIELKVLGSNGTSWMKGERKYYAYYEDLMRDKDSWLQFLGEYDNNVFAERSCKVLGTLATILRQRGDVDECEVVLEMEGLILPLYERHAFASEGYSGLYLFEALEYKYNRIRYNLYFQTSRKERSVQLFRNLAAYEIQREFIEPGEPSEYASLIPLLLGVPATMRNLAELRDADFQTMVDTMEKFNSALPPRKSKADKKTCAECFKKEDFRGDFNLCSGCKRVAYCCRACQKANWKEHKLQCAR